MTADTPAQTDVEALVATVRQAIGRLMIPDYEALAALDALVQQLQTLQRERDEKTEDFFKFFEAAAVEFTRAEAAEERAKVLEEALREMRDASPQSWDWYQGIARRALKQTEGET